MAPHFFSDNRKKLIDSLSGGGLVVMSAYGEIQQTYDMAAPFIQEANFWYLTGIEEPDWWIVIDGNSGSEYLVRPSSSDIKRVFDGVLTDEAATARSGIRQVLSRDEATTRLRDLSQHHSIVFTTKHPAHLMEHTTMQLNGSLEGMSRLLERIFKTVQLCNRELAVIRSIKQPAEIEAIQRAIAVTSAAFDSAKRTMMSATYEYQIEATMTHTIRSSGANHAYAPIVAAGSAACTLHYVRNDQKLVKPSLVLIDVGARVDGYTADITRTYSHGKPRSRQKQVHQAVQTAQAECIELLEPGVNFRDYEDRVQVIMKRAIASLGLSTTDYHRYFPHAISHGLGIDVHDALAGSDSLQPGMVLTVEPGIYLPDESIGVRIEDDVLITDSGHRNLSHRLSTDW